MKELFLSVSCKGYQINMGMQSKVIAEGELGKQVVRFLLFWGIKAEQEGFTCVSSLAYVNETNGIPMTCSWVKLSIAWRNSTSAWDAGISSLPVRSWSLLVLRVWAVCVHLYGEATKKATLFQGTMWCNWISTSCCILTVVSSGTKAWPAFLTKEMAMSRTVGAFNPANGEVPILFFPTPLSIAYKLQQGVDEAVDDKLTVGFVRFWWDHI